MTPQQIVDNCNALARAFYRMHGFQVPEGYRFDQANHPREISMWHLAMEAYDFIDGIDVGAALAALEEEAT